MKVFLHDEPNRYIPVVAEPAVESPITRVNALSALTRDYGPLLALENTDGAYILAAGADVVADLSDDSRFCKHVGSYLVTLRRFTGDGLFTAYNHEQNWATAHSVLTPGFSPSSMQAYHPVMADSAQRLLRKWDRCAAKQEPVQVSEDMTALTLDTIGLVGFGYDFRSLTRLGPHPFVAAMFAALSSTESADTGPTEGPLSAEGAKAIMNSVVDEVIAARAASRGADANDLLGLMLHSADQDTGRRLALDSIRNQIITFLVAGHETTSGALSFALYYLLKHPSALTAAQQEVDALWGRGPISAPGYSNIGKLKYVTQILHEALRLWPTAPGFAREARCDTTLCGYPIQAGQAVFVDLPVLHRDPVFGDNPALFDPDRFSPGAVKQRALQAFKPFGTGQRACIGRQFAMHEATMLLGLLVHRYRLVDYNDYQLAIKQNLTIKPDGFSLKVIRRAPTDRKTRHEQQHTGTFSTNYSKANNAPLPTAAPLQILFGSNLGTSRDIAHQIADFASQWGATRTVRTLDAAVGQLRPGSPVIVVTATYNGQPTDDATKFMSWLNDPATHLNGIPYTVLGIGDSTWAETYQSRCRS